MKQKISILIIVIASYFLSQWIEDIAAVTYQQDTKEIVQLDSYFNDLVVNINDQNDQLQYRLQAKKMNHFDNNISQIELPDIDLFEDNKIEWNIKSLTAEIQDKKGTIKLLKNVIAINETNKNDILIIKTEELNINNNKNTIITDKDVSFESSESFTTATGMLINTKKEKITLMNNVRSQYYDH